MLHIYRDDILTCNKNGTKYLSEQFGERKSIKTNTLYIDDSLINQIKYIVFKNPSDYLTSAIHTYYYSDNKTMTTSEYLDGLSRGQDTHWLLNYYHAIYTFSLKSNVLFIPLENLSSFISMKLKLKPIQLTELHRTVYGVNQFVADKDYDLHEFIRKNSPPHCNFILSRLGEQHEIYDKILKTSNVYKYKSINII